MNSIIKQVISTIGYSFAKKKIELYRFGKGSCKALLLGGVHGDEQEGFLLAERYIRSLGNGKLQLKDGLELYVCPRINPDGCESLRRTNHRNVDLNRNLPTKDWVSEFSNVRYYPGHFPGSEIETKLTLKLLRKIKPNLVISLHSYEKPMVNYNGPAKDLAVAMAKENGLIIQSDIGYPTPGSLGTFAGWERGLPTITLEIQRGQEPEEVWQTHHQALMKGTKYYLEPVSKSALKAT